VSEKNKVFVINTETVENLQVFSISGITDIRVIGGNKNAIVFTGNEDGTNFLMTSKIPTDYERSKVYLFMPENSEKVIF
ncbi:hypothetical protein PRIPAC_93361, partial [Pristionchus pacificus]